MRAIVLAAGEGSRLKPLTNTKPKGMVKAANRPIMQHAVEALVENGITDITFVVGYHRERVQSHFEDGHRHGCNIQYVFQESLLGTAHALAHVDFPGEDALVLGGDNVVDARLVKDLLAAEGDIRLVAHPSENPSKYGVLTLDGDRVARIEEKPITFTSEFVNTGVYRVPAGFHDAVRRGVKDGITGLTHLLQRLMEKGQEVQAVRSEGTWMDAVYPWDLLGLNAHLAPPRTDGDPPPGVAESAEVRALLGSDVLIGSQCVVNPTTSIGDNVTIGPGCIIENSIIYDDVQIGAGALIRNSVVGEGARIGDRFTALTGPCDVKVRDGHHALADFGCVLGEDARIGGGVTVAPGVLIGNRAQVAVGATVRANAPEGARVF